MVISSSIFDPSLALALKHTLSISNIRYPLICFHHVSSFFSIANEFKQSIMILVFAATLCSADLSIGVLLEFWSRRNRRFVASGPFKVFMFLVVAGIRPCSSTNLYLLHNFEQYCITITGGRFNSFSIVCVFNGHVILATFCFWFELGIYDWNKLVKFGWKTYPPAKRKYEHFSGQISEKFSVI